jgi:hypothetical protein
MKLIYPLVFFLGAIALLHAALLGCAPGFAAYEPVQVVPDASLAERGRMAQDLLEIEIPNDPAAGSSPELGSGSFHLGFEGTDVSVPDDSFINADVAEQGGIDRGSRVVIAVPSRRQQQTRVDNNDAEAFSTDGFFNISEREFERSFLRHGLSVVDRSVFEAKLRELRDAEATTNLHSEHTKAFNDRAANLRRLVERGAITDAEYERRLADAIEDVPSPGRRRVAGQNEVVDSPELLRAARSGEVRASFILQIGQCSLIRRSRIVDVREHPDFAVAETRFPGLAEELAAGGGRTELPLLVATVNAKLIDVRSGDVVWLGSHTLDSLESLRNDYKLVYGVKPQTRFDASRRSRIVEIREDLEDVRQWASFVAQAGGLEGSPQVQPPTTYGEIIKLRDELGDQELSVASMTALSQRFHEKLRELEQLLAAERNSARYQVEGPAIRADGNGTTVNLLGEERRRALARLTTRSLVSTIRLADSE